LVLTFDQAGFFVALYWLFGTPLSVMAGGWVAKMAAAAFYSLLVAGYLRLYGRRPEQEKKAPRIADLFGALTYRERYEELLERSGRDVLTGLHDRSYLESEGRRRVEEAAATDRTVTLMIVDIDHFKDFNDNHGHAAGDDLLRCIGQAIAASVRGDDLACRFGGEEFVVICESLAAEPALMLGEHVRARIAALDGPQRVTASIGIATAPQEAVGYDRLFELADARLYEAKETGRDRVIGTWQNDWSGASLVAKSA
jgi:diguanylate cyclase (GGDEF)-like protein